MRKCQFLWKNIFHTSLFYFIHFGRILTPRQYYFTPTCYFHTMDICFIPLRCFYTNTTISLYGHLFQLDFFYQYFNSKPILQFHWSIGNQDFNARRVARACCYALWFKCFILLYIFILHDMCFIRLYVFILLDCVFILVNYIISYPSGWIHTWNKFIQTEIDQLYHLM